MNHLRESPAARGLFGLLLTLVLAVRVAIPLGYMPSEGPHPITLALTICNGMAPAKSVVTIPVKGDHERKSQASDSACPFAAGLGSGLLSSEPDPTAPVVAPDFAVALFRAITDLTPHRMAAPPPPAHAPPALV